MKIMIKIEKTWRLLVIYLLVTKLKTMFLNHEYKNNDRKINAFCLIN